MTELLELFKVTALVSRRSQLAELAGLHPSKCVLNIALHSETGSN